MQVHNVITKDTSRDISDLLNSIGQFHNFDPIGFLAGIIAESNITERALRDESDGPHIKWPDISWGLTQQTLKYLHRHGPLVDRDSDGWGIDSPRNRSIMADFFFDAQNAIDYSAPIYKRFLDQENGDPVRAWSRWNKPSIDPDNNPAKAAYQRAYQQAQAYARADTVDDDLMTILNIQDMRGLLPVLRDRGNHWATMDYDVRLLDPIISNTVHYTGGPAHQTVAAIASYQISDQAAPQTGTRPPQPFPGLAYHFMVEQDGSVYWCHDLTVEVWHSPRGFNKTDNAICYTGLGPPNTAQIDGIARASVFCEKMRDRFLSTRAHKDGYPTLCPVGWPDWKQDLLSQIGLVRSLIVVPTPTITKSEAIGQLDKVRQDIEAAMNTYTDMLRVLINNYSPTGVTVDQAIGEIGRIGQMFPGFTTSIAAMVDRLSLPD